MKLHEHTRDFLGRCLTGQEAWSFLRTLCEDVGTRLSGSDEEGRAAQLLGASKVRIRGGGRAREIPSHLLGWSPGASVETPSLHAFMEEIGHALHLTLEVPEGMSRYSDHFPFREKGVPGAAFLCRSPSSGFGHTDHDSLDKVEPESFTIPLLVAGAALIECAMRSVRFPVPA